MWDLIVSVPDHCLSFYFPLTSSIAQCSSAQSRPIRTSITDLFASRGNLLCLRCGHRWMYLLQSKADMLPVTPFAVYVVIFELTLSVTLSNSTSIGFVSVSTRPFKTFTGLLLQLSSAILTAPRHRRSHMF